ncbi:glycosyltransferase family 92 protein Os08g0121900 [Phoenix dactylifera]|uniref:Glycosyltransferase family 92 protein n=1 Tax=Phoenix dactylifera TaxID=42345 RepID=A0A8B9ALX9_PHODC|nr:glycosyltransferase family 92 protein Os08g0121900 [Phoenix dactylifera]
MKDRRRREGAAWRGPSRAPPPSSSCSSFAVFAFLCFALFAAFAFSTFRLFGVSFRPVLISTWQSPAMNAVSGEVPLSRRGPAATLTSLQIQEAISFPDQVLLFLKSPSSLPSDLLCLYYPSSPTAAGGRPDLRLPPLSSSSPDPLLVRCPLAPGGFSISLSASASPSPSLDLPPIRPRPWDHLAYAAVFDPRDNSTIVFAKGLNLRPTRLSDPSRYECIFGWNFLKPKYLLTSATLSAAQEIIRCKTPRSILLRHRRQSNRDPPLVSVKSKGRGSFILPSIARPDTILSAGSRRKKEHLMCVCTMVRNQARFLREWIVYHSRIGVQRWFIYDNNSDDGVEQVIESMASSSNYNVTRHPWPWIKTQEAGFAHCALRARDHCEWVGFIDVDEFLHLPTDATLHNVLRHYSSKPRVGELRTACHSFGPSGRKTMPPEGVIVGYTCRMNIPERHKSIVRPEALNPSLINVVHHFHLKDGMRYVNMDRGVMVINHYKYQVWEVFKEKFHRRVATYVADWQDEENVGSKDRAPGLGTKAVEPPDWPSRFCEVNDTGLRDWVLRAFGDPNAGLLPW